MKKHHIESLISRKEVQTRIAELAEQINNHYQQTNCQNLVVVGLLRGSFMFMADLVRLIDIPVEVDFMTVSSYGSSTESSRDVKILKDLEGEINGKDVLIVEDIIDTGFTLNKVRDILRLRDPRSVSICTLLDKPSRREVAVPVEWVGFAIPDEFVVGYGIDYAQKYRNLDFIGKVVMDE
ncbi:hypoxanthine phosphoribosyltransferase [[Haemophilus] ducreyi]|uniref:Hypoxanthine phosphoribosyltransferase n=2 Tax=Haemophilus ducreyi TaxID=730 RepID=Q7VLM5_HAEDU|nr:hypoxanthine phosphoribosyltransferase [[Haemophilus] ducreyi]AAP96210.1 hypoxanthine phosphoribosyl transferase (HPRT) [[Haemophilus] ducreyi 35000HP]AKO31167.1 hypoxanthine phosphoribosyltransferase [[Haemophilus] ducreyi]AKO32614.1 hypoxanthine phosphoribosyltransferase [[Haemophilus] ducreyi]AKO34064.1 hypoxanthine phosphoribosyltransferase [[Haemophilus] ducreyi]AKO35510.1 hypoxanthine phosphoribosyltransferase [[Haemophilus] ducreyi]